MFLAARLKRLPRNRIRNPGLKPHKRSLKAATFYSRHYLRLALLRSVESAFANRKPQFSSSACAWS
jgi:hypothetical protein